MLTLRWDLPNVSGRSNVTAAPSEDSTSNGLNQRAVSLYGMSMGVCLESNHTLSPDTTREATDRFRIVTFLPVQKSFVPAVSKCDVFREGCDKKRHKLQKYFRVRERHILPRNVTNVTRHIFCYQKK